MLGQCDAYSRVLGIDPENDRVGSWLPLYHDMGLFTSWLLPLLERVPVVAIEPPDESLLAAVIVKLLSDRQLPATPPAVSHLVRHMERSFEMAVRLVGEIDRLLWEKPREVTREVAKQALVALPSKPEDAR